MDKNSFKVLFYVSRTKVTKNGEIPILMRITVAGQRVNMYVKRTVEERKYGMGKNTHCLSKMKVDKGRHRIASKSLCNIPGRFADEMIARGWILRNEIIWYKPSVNTRLR